MLFSYSIYIITVYLVRYLQDERYYSNMPVSSLHSSYLTDQIACINLSSRQSHEIKCMHMRKTCVLAALNLVWISHQHIVPETNTDLNLTPVIVCTTQNQML